MFEEVFGRSGPWGKFWEVVGTRLKGLGKAVETFFLQVQRKFWEGFWNSFGRFGGKLLNMCGRFGGHVWEVWVRFLEGAGWVFGKFLEHAWDMLGTILGHVRSNVRRSFGD